MLKPESTFERMQSFVGLCGCFIGPSTPQGSKEPWFCNGYRLEGPMLVSFIDSEVQDFRKLVQKMWASVELVRGLLSVLQSRCGWTAEKTGSPACN